MTDKQKLRMKIGAFEFEAEGDKASVEEQLRQFLAIVNKSPIDTKPNPAAKLNGASGLTPPPADDETPLSFDGVEEAVLAKVFKFENELLSLRILPKTKAYAADALMLLIYGHKIYKNEDQALVGHLMREAKQSGLKIDRVDRVLSVNNEYLNKGGARKGAKYSLNNPGFERAKEIIGQMFD